MLFVPETHSESAVLVMVAETNVSVNCLFLFFSDKYQIKLWKQQRFQAVEQVVTHFQNIFICLHCLRLWRAHRHWNSFLWCGQIVAGNFYNVPIPIDRLLLTAYIFLGVSLVWTKLYRRPNFLQTVMLDFSYKLYSKKNTQISYRIRYQIKGKANM